MQFRMKAVNDLSRGVGIILERNQKAAAAHWHVDDDRINHDRAPPIFTPKAVIKDLDTSIRYRRLLTATKYGSAEDGGDAGHAYMVEILEHCRAVLVFARQVAKVVWKDHQQKNISKGEHGDDCDHASGSHHGCPPVSAGRSAHGKYGRRKRLQFRRSLAATRRRWP